MVERLKCCENAPRTCQKWQRFYATMLTAGKTLLSPVKMIIEGAEVEVLKRNELHKFVVIPTRWVVERSFVRLEKNRRLWKNCERKIHNTLQMTVLALISLLLKRY
jgi:transposase